MRLEISETARRTMRRLAIEGKLHPAATFPHEWKHIVGSGLAMLEQGYYVPTDYGMYWFKQHAPGVA